ncbi:LanC-like protein 3-like [Homarus americanus]|uniref:LanC-like protein 3-like n=1 Tax=Homarus americanus TaxID=6706 RepID=A0A8J5NDS8_HOMAM|nr:LanC-like protein 3-like [Homarus americanus]
MFSPKRYFVNNLPEYNGKDVTIDKAEIKRRTLDRIQTITQKWTKNHRNCDGGLYVGIPGAIYTLYRLSKMPDFSEERGHLLEQAAGYLKPALEFATHTKASGSKVDVVAFILGNAGIYAVAAVIFQALGNMKESEKYASEFSHLAAHLIPVNWYSHGGDEFLVGRAGYLAGLIWLQSELKRDILPEPAVSAILDAMIESGQKYAHDHKSRIPLMYQYYKTDFPSWLSCRPHAKELIKKSLDALLVLQAPNGNFPSAMDEIDGQRPPEEELVHWCHGAPGTVYLLAKAYMVYEDKRYLQACIKCGDVTWHKGLLKKGPGICHGVAGSGYVFLTLFRLTGDPNHLHRALQFCNFLNTREFCQARTPDSPYSLYEGLAGTACFIADFLNPEQSSFPFFNVF